MRPRAHTSESVKGRRALLLLLILAAAGLRWHDRILENAVTPDEAVYLGAAEHWSQGRSPYGQKIFFYTPFFAWVSAVLVQEFDTLGALKILRLANLIGICVTTWLALVIATWRGWPALIFGIAWVCLSPVVALQIHLGNLTGISAALTMAGLYLWLRRPVAAGTALGLAQALKPIAPLAPFFFLAHRPEGARRPALEAGVASLATVGLLLLVGWRFLPEIAANASGASNPYNFSLRQIFTHLDLNVGPFWIAGVVGLAGTAWIATRELSKLQFLVIVLTLNLAATPILWAHSLLPLLPIQLLAAERIVRSLPWRRPDPVAALPHVLAGLAVVSTLFSASIGGWSSAPSWIQAAVLAVPFLSIPYLGGYVLVGLRDRGARPQWRPSQSG